MGKFLAFIFGLGKDEHTKGSYYYDDIEGYEEDTTIYRTHDIIHDNDCFDGGDEKRERDYSLYKASDIF